MTVTLPGWLKEVLDFVGMHFPEGDEDKLAQRGKAFDAFADALGEIGMDLGLVMRQIEDAVGGEIEQKVKAFIDELNQQSVGPQQENQSALGSQSATMAEATQFGKYSIILTLAALAIQLAVALANFWNGAGEAEAAAVIVEGRVVIGGILEEIATKVLGKLATSAITKVIAKQAGIGLLMGAGVDAAAQGIQIIEGTRKSFDGKQFVADAAAGAAGGAVGGALGHAIAGKEAQTLAGKIGKGLLGGAVGGGAGAVAGGLAAGAVTGNLDHAFDGAGGQALLGAVAGAGGGAREAVSPTGGRPVESVHATEAPKIENGKPASLTESVRQGGTADPSAPSAEPAPRSPEHAPGPEHEQASLTQHPEAQQSHDQAQPVAAVDQRTPVAEPKPGAEQRAPQPGEQARPNAPATDRPPVNTAQQPASAAGERAPTPAAAARVADQPTASLSSATSDKPHTGAAATMKDTPVVKAAEPVAAKPGEQLRATAGPVETRPSEQPHEPASQASALDHETRPAEAARPDLPARNPDVAHDEIRLSDEARSEAHGHVSDQAAHDFLARPDKSLDALTPVGQDHARQVVQHMIDHPGERFVEMRGERVPEHLWRAFHEDPAIRHGHVIPNEIRTKLFRADVEEWHALHPNDKAVTDLWQAVQPRTDIYGRTYEPYILDAHMDGRAVLCTGDPDKATHLATLVTGTGGDVHKLIPADQRAKGALGQFKDRLFGHNPDDVGYQAKADRIKDKMLTELRRVPGAKPDVIVYQGSENPSHIGKAADHGYAERAAPDIQRMANGLFLTHEGGLVRSTFLGHSYGSTSLGHATRLPGGLNAHGAVLFGSPGTGGQHVGEMRLHHAGGDGVHVLLNSRDVIKVVDFARILGLDRFGIGHGLMPHHEGFGASLVPTHDVGLGETIKSVGVRGHSSYLDKDSLGLENIGKLSSGIEPDETVYYGQPDLAPGNNGYLPDEYEPDGLE